MAFIYPAIVALQVQESPREYNARNVRLLVVYSILTSSRSPSSRVRVEKQHVSLTSHPAIIQQKLSALPQRSQSGKAALRLQSLVSHPAIMDPMSIISLTGNIIQFVQFAAQLVSKGRKISESKEGALIDHVDLSATATHLVDLSKHVSGSLRTLDSSRSPSTTDQKLRAVCQECSTIASELIAVLERLRLHGKRSKWRSTRQAFKSICGQKTVNDLKTRLDSFRGVLDTTLLVALRFVLRYSSPQIQQVANMT